MIKKILIISSEFPPQPGGIANHAYHLAMELGERGYQVTVLSEIREQQPGDWQSFTDLHPKLTVIGVPRHRISPVTYGRRFSKASALLSSDSWHTVIFSGKSSVFLAGIFTPSRSVLVLHGTEIRQTGFQRILLARGLRKASRIICVSTYTKQQLISEHGDWVNEKSEIINNGIRNDWENSTGKKPPEPHQKLKLITVGGIHRRKGQFNVIAALPSIIKEFPRAEYHIAGIPSQKKELVSELNSLGLRDSVFFHHELRDSEIRDLLDDCHVFLMLSEHLPNGDFEGFGIAIVEAMALGLPAIGAKDSGIADAIENRVTGRLVDPQNQTEVVQALKDVLSDYTRYSRRAAKAAEGARWQHRISQYQKVIESL